MNAATESIGPLQVEASPSGISRVRFGASGAVRAPAAGAEPGSAAARLAEAGLRQLDEYLAGERTTFELPLDLTGATPFRRRVLEALLEIPYGETRSYGEIARKVGCRSARAVGGAVGWNPLPVIIPCHRVVAGDGGLGGFSGGLERKRALLALEGGRSLDPMKGGRGRSSVRFDRTGVNREDARPLEGSARP